MDSRTNTATLESISATSRLRRSLRKALRLETNTVPATSTATPDKAKRFWLQKFARFGWHRGETITSARTPDTDVLMTTPRLDQADPTTKEGSSPAFSTLLYSDMEDAMSLCRLEEPRTTMAALRYIVRTRHPKGRTITFPVPEAADDLYLGTQGLPSDAEELESLLKRAFARRNRSFDLNSVYRDFVMAHGRMAMDYSKTWPQSRIHIRDP